MEYRESPHGANVGSVCYVGSVCFVTLVPFVTKDTAKPRLDKQGSLRMNNES